MPRREPNRRRRAPERAPVRTPPPEAHPSHPPRELVREEPPAVEAPIPSKSPDDLHDAIVPARERS